MEEFDSSFSENIFLLSPLGFKEALFFKDALRLFCILSYFPVFLQLYIYLAVRSGLEKSFSLSSLVDFERWRR